MFKIKQFIKAIVRKLYPFSNCGSQSTLEINLDYDFKCQLRTVTDVEAILAKIDYYNTERSLEAGKPIFDSNRVILFTYALQLVKSLNCGDYAEVGTYRGMTASLIYPEIATGCSLHCFDTFKGFSSDDLAAESSQLDIAFEVGKFKDTSLEFVRSRITADSIQSDRLQLIQGVFPGSAAKYTEKMYRFVHLDVDLEEPIKRGLEFFWPRLVPGGIILVHDYLSPQYPGVKIAVDQFCKEIGNSVIPWCDRLGTALIVKNPT